MISLALVWAAVTWANASTPVISTIPTDAIVSVFRLIQPESRNAVLQKNANFTIKDCKKVPPQQWTQLLLAQQPVTYETQFNPGCDVEGRARVTLTPFPIDLALRNFEGVSRITMTLHITLVPKLEQGGIEVNFKATQGKVYAADSSKKKSEPTQFSGEYKSLYNFQGRLVKQPGGHIHVGSQKVDFVL